MAYANTSASLSPANYSLHSSQQSCSVCSGNTGVVAPEGFPGEFLVHVQHSADGSGSCQFVGDSSQAEFDARTPLLATGELGTKCLSSTTTKNHLNVMLHYFDPSVGTKRCDSRMLIEPKTGPVIAHCQMLKAVSCLQRRCESTTCSSQKIVTCKEVCKAVEDPEHSDPTNGITATMYQLVGWKGVTTGKDDRCPTCHKTVYSGNHGATWSCVATFSEYLKVQEKGWRGGLMSSPNVDCGGAECKRYIQKMVPKQSECTTQCTNETEKWCADLGRFD